MHSPKKPVLSTGSKSNTSTLNSSRNTAKRKAVSDKKTFEEMFKMSVNQKGDFIFDEETKSRYSLALGYVNHVHNCMNKKLCENYGECGDANSETNGIFRMPDIPNYSTIFHILLEKSKPLDVPVRAQVKEEARCGNKSNISELVSDIQKMTELKAGQIVGETTTKNGPQGSRKGKGIPKPSGVKQKNDVRDLNVHVKSEESVRKVEDSNKEVIAEEHSMEKTKEKTEITDTANTDPNFPQCVPEKPECIEDNHRNNVCDKLLCMDHESIMDLIKQQVQEEFSFYLKTTSEKQAKLESSSHHAINPQPQLNLLEYAQKKMERKSLETQKEDAQRKVNEMFQRISQENTGQYPRTEEEESDDLNMSSRLEDESDSDSVILDDEEFERTHRECRRADNIQERGGNLLSYMGPSANRGVFSELHYTEDDGNIVELFHRTDFWLSCEAED